MRQSAATRPSERALVNEPSPWISFDKAQPKPGQAVLLRYANGDMCYAENWRLDQCTASKTHWMAVPELPEPYPFEEWFRKTYLPLSADYRMKMQHAWNAGVKWAMEHPEG